MTSNDDINSLLSQLQNLEKSKDYANIINTLNPNFDSKTDDIIKQWISNSRISNDEKKYVDLYSDLQLSFVQYCFFNSNTIANVQTLIDKFRQRLFQKSQIDTLKTAVEFIREGLSNSNNEDDFMLIYIMRMIDARSLAYRLCFEDISPPKMLNDELIDCLIHRQAKNYLYDVKSTSGTNENMSIDYRQKFFLGCCTFAVALYRDNKNMLKDDERYNKYICLLAKYVRIMLKKKDFAKNESILYCIRGILALFTNCVPIEHWLSIMNKALVNETDDNAQQQNPFNLDLFSLIINQLLASTTLQKKTEESTWNNETLLLDTVLVFLVKWSDTQNDPNEDDDDEVDKNNNNNSSPFDEPNQLLHCIRTHEDFQHSSQIIIPYIDAKYDRIRLMALSMLSNIMNNENFKELKTRKPNMDKDLVKLIFDFLNEALKQPNSIYKGISFNTLLRYLHRFLVQDFIKETTLPYISQIVYYAKNHQAYALKILRRISTNPTLKVDLLKNVDLEQFLKADADIIYNVNPKMSRIIKDIRGNLAPPKPIAPLPPDNGNYCQALISYCHDNRDKCESILQKLEEAKIFTNIWVDKDRMKDNMVETVSKAMSESKIIFVLLSDDYCKSDFCRREWNYAIEKKIKAYVIVVQKDFKKTNYDWVIFSIGGERYYKIHEFPQLLKHLSETLNVELKHEANTKKDENETKLSSPLQPTPQSMAPTDNREYLTKTSIATWTSEDIRNWCIVNHLDKWCEALANYDGENLLELCRYLSNDSHIQYFLMNNTFDVFDVARFKSEIDKLLLKAKTEHKPPTKKHVLKRRTSKSSMK